MTRLAQSIRNRHHSRELYKPWKWPGILIYSRTRPVGAGLYLLNFFAQRIFGINGRQTFMVHYTSQVSGKVEIGRNVWKSFAVSGGCYIQGDKGIFIGDDTIFAPGVKIISANHDVKDFAKQVDARPIRIGKNCWLSANAVILPGVELGDNVVVGAGAVVTKSFPSNVVLAGVPAKVIREII
jgi:acetyltransferase-like isoleucine patch superfamily enzyme